jgi:hypothetical protein
MLPELIPLDIVNRLSLLIALMHASSNESYKQAYTEARSDAFRQSLKRVMTTQDKKDSFVLSSCSIDRLLPFRLKRLLAAETRK